MVINLTPPNKYKKIGIPVNVSSNSPVLTQTPAQGNNPGTPLHPAPRKITHHRLANPKTTKQSNSGQGYTTQQPDHHSMHGNSLLRYSVGRGKGEQ